MTSSSGTSTRRTESRSFLYLRTLREGSAAVRALLAKHASANASTPTTALMLRRIVGDLTAVLSPSATSPAPHGICHVLHPRVVPPRIIAHAATSASCPRHPAVVGSWALRSRSLPNRSGSAAPA